MTLSQRLNRSMNRLLFALLVSGGAMLALLVCLS